MNQNMTTWTCKEDEKLIRFVKNHEMLYNIKNKDYRKSKLKQNLWCEMGSKLNKTDLDCSKRWAYIRDYYIRRKRKPGNGSSSELLRKRSDLLSFLDICSSSKQGSITNVTVEKTDMNETAFEDDTILLNTGKSISHDSEEENIYVEKQFFDRDEQECQRKKKTLFHSEEQIAVLKKIAERKQCSAILNETDHFFMSFSKIVQKLPRYEQVKLRMEISNLVGNAELRHLAKAEYDEDKL